MKTNIILDFDSTFVTVEALEQLASLAFSGRENKEALVAEIACITKLGMEGVIPFHESLSSRIKLLSANKNHVEKFKKELKGKISPSIVRNKEFFRKNREQIYIISGGFFDYIYPVVKDFGVKKDHVLANYFIYDNAGQIIGYDEHIPLCRAFGKAELVRSLALTGEVLVVGDGYNDYEIKKEGAADQFLAYVENVRREKVVRYADHVIENFDQLIRMLK